MSKDHYDVLGVSSAATSDEIKRSYRKLAVLYHPDKNPDPKVAERFKEITDAYNTLSDQESRRRYDQRFSSAFEETFSKEPEVKHRDPRYRAKSRNDGDKWTMKELITIGVVYTRYCCYAGLFICTLLAIDYLLPYRTHNARITDIYSVRFRRGTAYSVVRTDSGKGLKMYDNAGCFRKGEPIVVKITWIYSIPMSASSPSTSTDIAECAVVKMGYLFRSQVFFPAILLVLSLLGSIRKVGMETNFNFGIGAGIFVLIHVYLLLSA